jgi:NADH:ubiquinone oxidoreductase subunit 2 (subunit N)
MKKLLAYIATIVSAFTLPALAFAQAITSVQSGGEFIINIINTVAVPVLFAIAFIVFIFGIFQYFILARGDEEKQAQGRSLMLYGLVGFFLMVSVWGLVNILLGTFNFDAQVPQYPSAPLSQ